MNSLTASAGDVVLPGDEAWDAARQAWNLTVDQRPVAVVYPESADDVVATVRFAAEQGLRIAFNAGGHNAGPIDWSRDTLLLKTERMDGDRDRRGGASRARRAGALSQPLAVAAGEHGLAYLAGTSPNVGVLGYALGGGLSWMIRTFGLACNSIVSAEVVTADGRLVTGGPRDRARAVLGAPRWRRERRRRHRDRARAVPDRRDLCRGAVLADRAGGGDPQGLARMDRNRARGVRIARPHAPAARTSRSCPKRFAAGRSSWSRRRSSATRAMAPRCCSRSATSGRRWTPSR